jgi:hypothetical protein
MNAITPEDLAQALEVQKSAGQNRKPLISTLIELGRLGPDEASRGLRKLIEMTLVDLIGYSKGSFTLDTDVITVSPECNYPLSKMEQEISVDAQMILMDALRIYDERERDRQAGKTVPSDEEYFADVITEESSVENTPKSRVLTADDLGLSDLEHLERKIPQFVPTTQIFDPLQIHRQKIMETLSDFSTEEQETFVSFLEKSTMRIDISQSHESRASALVLFSEDELLKYSVMTICKGEGVLVFATEGEEELVRIVDQCLTIKILPVLVYDCPVTSEGLLSRNKIVNLRQQVRKRYPNVSIIQLAPLTDYSFTLQSLSDGVRTVFPKPSKETGNATFISDMMTFLETFKFYIKDLFREQKDLFPEYNQLRQLKDSLIALGDLHEPLAITLALLNSVAEVCERSITFIVRSEELIGEKTIGVYADKNRGPASATKLKLPLTKPSVFRNVIEKGQFFYGETEDEILRKYLFDAIGAPLRPSIILLPIKRNGKTIALTYGDFGRNEPQPLQSDLLEIMALEAGLVLENVLYRKQHSKSFQK